MRKDDRSMITGSREHGPTGVVFSLDDFYLLQDMKCRVTWLEQVGPRGAGNYLDAFAETDCLVEIWLDRVANSIDDDVRRQRHFSIS